MEGDTPDKSKYNEGLLQIQRLNDIWLHCHSLRRQDKLTELSFELNGAWVELSRDANKLTPTHQKKINIFNKQTETCYGFTKSIIGKDLIISDIKKLRDILMKKEIYLREIQDECGKGGSYKDESAEDFE